jgi:hypothetical protein
VLGGWCILLLSGVKPLHFDGVVRIFEVSVTTADRFHFFKQNAKARI